MTAKELRALLAPIPDDATIALSMPFLTGHTIYSAIGGVKKAKGKERTGTQADYLIEGE